MCELFMWKLATIILLQIYKICRDGYLVMDDVHHACVWLVVWWSISDREDVHHLSEAVSEHDGVVSA